ncbi:MAG: NAD(P)H-hydrate dehydratase [Candidatus Peregrinibacteria bacterium]
MIPIPKRFSASHKGQNGTVLVVGGNEIFHGAPLLAAKGAEKSGADLIFLCLPACHAVPARVASLNFIVTPFTGGHLEEEDFPLILSRAEKADVVLMGNGLGVGGAQCVEALLKSIVRHFSHLPLVLDADALIPEILSLFVFSPDTSDRSPSGISHPPTPLTRGAKRGSQIVLTPHSGEYTRLFGQTPTVEHLKKMAKQHQCVILLKGEIDNIAGPNGEFFENTTGSSLMTVGGTGDSLAGILAGYIAQGMTPFDAAVSSAFSWGKCGEELEKTQSSASAMEMLEVFPKIQKLFFTPSV